MNEKDTPITLQLIEPQSAARLVYCGYLLTKNDILQAAWFFCLGIGLDPKNEKYLKSAIKCLEDIQIFINQKQSMSLN